MCTQFYMDLIDFLRRRGVGEAYLEKMTNDKIDCDALVAMDDENRQRYIPLYGDQVSAIAFCKARVGTVAEEGGKAQRATLLERLTRKNGRAKTGTRNRHAVKEKRRVELGWMNFDIRTQTYKLVRQMKGGGTRFLSVDKDSTLADIFARGQDLFFSDSNTSYQSELRDFCGNIVTDLNRTVEQCYEDTKLKILRLHVYSQRLDGSKPISSNKDVGNEDCDFDLPAPLSRAHRQPINVTGWHHNTITASTTPDVTSAPVITAMPVVTTVLNVMSTPDVTMEPVITTSQVATITPVITSTSAITATPAVTTMSDVTTQPLIPTIPAVTATPDKTECLTDFAPAGTPTVMFRCDATMSSSIEDMVTGDDEDDQMLQEALRRSLESDPTLPGLLEFWSKQTRNTEQESIIVQRGKVLKCTLRTVLRPTFDWFAPVKVVYAGEIGDDLGGPKREFLRELVSEVVHDVLSGPDENKVFKHDIGKLSKKHYEVAGKLTAFSLLNGGPGMPVFNEDVYSMMTGGELIHHIQDTDLSECGLEKETQTHLEKMKQAATDEEFKKCLEDDSDWLLAQGMTPFRLKFEQKNEVLDNLLKHFLYYRVHSEISQFTNGLDIIGGFFQMVCKHQETMKPLFVDPESALTFESFRALYKINFSPVGSNSRKGENDSIYCFEAFLMDCEGQRTGVTLGQVLGFWTGATTVPPMGFNKDLEIDFVTSAGPCLPVAHTCFMSLNLKRGITEPELFEEDMVKAINWTGGFHLC